MAEMILYLGAVLVLAVAIGTLFSCRPARGYLRAFGDVLLALKSFFVGG